jgi:hypothetical protein
MGFFNSATIGFGGVTNQGGGSSGGDNSIIFKEVDSSILDSERIVGTREATGNITYTLPAKSSVTGNGVFEFINFNNDYSVNIVDSENGDINGQSSVVLFSKGNNIVLVLDKENNTWKSVD